MNARILLLLFLGGCWPYLAEPYAPGDAGDTADTGNTTDTGSTGPTACADEGGVVVGLSVDGTLTDGTTWRVGDVQLTTAAFGGTFWGAPDNECLTLAPGELDIDVSQVGCVVTSVRIDVTDWCGTNCTEAVGYGVDAEVASAGNGSAVGTPTTLVLDADTPMRSVSLQTYEGTVCTVRLY